MATGSCQNRKYCIYIQSHVGFVVVVVVVGCVCLGFFNVDFCLYFVFCICLFFGGFS